MSYHAVCTGDQQKEKRFELPAALEAGYALSVNMDNGQIFVSVSCRDAARDTARDVARHVSTMGGDTLYLLAHTRGMVHFVAPWNANRKSISLPQREFPSGVLHFVLFDAQLNPVSERLVFVNNNDQARATLRSDRDSFAVRSLVNNHVALTDEYGRPLAGNFSVSVTADHAVKADSTNSILTHLLLTSDLRGHIENPTAYFKKDDKSVAALDLLMLTQGWRRYDMAAIAKGRPAVPDVPVEFGSEITGRVKRLFADRSLEKAKVSIMANKDDYNYFDMMETDSVGRFRFNTGDQPDSVTFVVQAVTTSGNTNLELLVDEELFAEKKLSIVAPPEEVGKKNMEEYTQIVETAIRGDDFAWDLLLSEVTVTAKAPLPKSVLRDSYQLDEEQLQKISKNNGIYSLLQVIPHVHI
jgi:hypothetical protein